MKKTVLLPSDQTYADEEQLIATLVAIVRAILIRRQQKQDMVQSPDQHQKHAA